MNQDHRIKSALGNMPIWIQRCNIRMNCIARIEGATNDAHQLYVLSDYMRALLAQ
jgi:hypothetical protein